MRDGSTTDMASELDPNDPEPYYSIGVIDWTSCYQPRMEARAESYGCLRRESE